MPKRRACGRFVPHGLVTKLELRTSPVALAPYVKRLRAAWRTTLLELRAPAPDPSIATRNFLSSSFFQC